MLTSPKFTSLVEAVTIIAMRSPIGAVRGTEVCDSLGLPERYLEPEFQSLSKSGILKSVRGPKGGYVLAREKRNISLLDIYEALSSGERPQKSSKFAKLINDKIEVISQSLATISVHDILAEGKEKGLIKPDAEKADFII